MNGTPDAPGALDAVLHAVAALTAQMLAASDRQDWPLVSDLEARRFGLLSNFSPTGFSSDRDTVQAVLREALASTQCITARIRAAQADEHRALATLRHGSRSARRYLDVAASR